MKNFNIIDKQGIKLNTANTYVDDDINVGLTQSDKDNLVAENIKKDVEVLGIVGTNTMASYDSAFREVGDHELHMVSSLGINYQKNLHIDDVQSVVVNDTCYLSTGEDGNIIADNLSSENIKKDINILGVVGSYEGDGGSCGASLNVVYGTTPPTDTSKIWLECEEPQAVEVQNYLGECAVSDVANYGGIDNPVDAQKNFHSGLYNACYIGNNQIAIVGYNHIRIYDLISKSYIADYKISVGTSVYYSNVLFKDNVLYFGYEKTLYSYDLTTQTLINLIDLSSYSYVVHIFFNTENEIDILQYCSSDSLKNRRTRYNLNSGSKTEISSVSDNYGSFSYMYGTTSTTVIKANNYVYCFLVRGYTSSVDHHLKYNLLTNKIEEFKSLQDFVTSFGDKYFQYASTIYDGERYIYVIGGGYTNIGYNNIIKYDITNDTFEMLDKKLISTKQYHFSVLVDNRVYIFGGIDDRPNLIDYFDLQYPLAQNNAIITTNTINTDNALPLINTEKLKLNSNIASAYKGNADNLAEKVNAYYYDGSKWVGINCDDYYFEWSTIPNQTVGSNSSVTIDLSSYCTNNTESEVVFTARESGDVSYFSLVVSGTQLTISPAVSSAKTSTIYVTATVNGKAYTTSFNVTVDDLS